MIIFDSTHLDSPSVSNIEPSRVQFAESRSLAQRTIQLACVLRNQGVNLFNNENENT